MRKTGNIVLLVFFALLVAVPLVTADFAGGKISETEKRVLASHPTLRDENGSLSPSALINSTDAWIKDNIGGRKLASDFWTTLQYRAFSRSARQNVIIGKEDWIYYAPEAVLADYTGDNLLNEQQVETYIGWAAQLDEALKARGIRVAWTIIPDKKTVYPEYYPDGIVPARNGTRTDQIVREVSNRTDMRLIDLRPVIKAHKGEDPLYFIHADDSHWNYRGAYLGVQEYCRTFGVETVPFEACGAQEMVFPGNFNGAIQMDEPVRRPVTGRENTYTLDNDFYDRFPQLAFSDSPESFRWRSVNEDSSLPSLLCVGDSYFVMSRDYLGQYFSSVTFLHMLDSDALGEMIEAVQPDCVLFETVERMLQLEPEMLQRGLASMGIEAKTP